MKNRVAEKECRRFHGDESEFKNLIMFHNNRAEELEAELATLKAEKEKADQIIKDLSGDRMLYRDMAERAEARMMLIAVFLVKILDDGMISRGVFAELMQIDRCDIDDVTQAIRKTAEKP